MRMKVENLHFSYGSREVLKGVSFGIADSGFVSVLGPNGAGKSTLFRCMLGLLEPSEGSVHICGRNIRQMPPAELSHRVAYIPQSHTPVFNFSVFDMVLMGTTAQLSRFSSPGKKEAQLAEAAMERIGISHLRDRGCGNISGGELQLALIARTLVSEPKILILDEPESHLDINKQKTILETIKKLVHEQGLACIINTHYPNHAFYFGDKVLMAAKNRPIITGQVADVMTPENILNFFGISVERLLYKQDGINYETIIPSYFGKPE